MHRSSHKPSRYVVVAVLVGVSLLAATAAAFAADPPTAAATPPDSAGAAPAAGAAGGGQAAFNNHCRTCHSPKPGDNRLGPALGGIVGQKSGSRPGYGNYSQALKSANVTWDETTLEKFIENPEAVVPNNNMKPYKGVPDEKVRKTIIEYLKTLSS